MRHLTTADAFDPGIAFFASHAARQTPRILLVSNLASMAVPSATACKPPTSPRTCASKKWPRHRRRLRPAPPQAGNGGRDHRGTCETI